MDETKHGMCTKGATYQLRVEAPLGSGLCYVTSVVVVAENGHEKYTAATTESTNGASLLVGQCTATTNKSSFSVSD